MVQKTINIYEEDLNLLISEARADSRKVNDYIRARVIHPFCEALRKSKEKEKRKK